MPSPPHPVHLVPAAPSHGRHTPQASQRRRSIIPSFRLSHLGSPFSPHPARQSPTCSPVDPSALLHPITPQALFGMFSLCPHPAPFPCTDPLAPLSHTRLLSMQRLSARPPSLKHQFWPLTGHYSAPVITPDRTRKCDGSDPAAPTSHSHTPGRPFAWPWALEGLLLVPEQLGPALTMI